MSVRKLGTFKSILVASPDYLKRRGTPKVPTDLLGHVCLHYRFPNSGKLDTWPLSNISGEPELQLPTSMICNNIETRVCLARQGRGIAFLPDYSINEFLADGRLCRVLPDYVERTGTFNMLWPASKHPSPKVRALVDFMCARMFPATDSNKVSNSGEGALLTKQDL